MLLAVLPKRRKISDELIVNRIVFVIGTYLGNAQCLLIIRVRETITKISKIQKELKQSAHNVILISLSA